MSEFDYIKALELYRACLQQKYIHTSDDVSYSITYNGTMTIYFQWSNSFKDWIKNFDFPVKPYKRMQNVWYVHRGFGKAWKSIEDTIGLYILACNPQKIVCVGYSHGAPLSALCHEYCKFNFPDIKVTGYGFGSPRVLWGRYTPELLSRWDDFTVIRNYDDIVTHLPPKIFGYRHVGNMIDLTLKGTFKGEKKLLDRYIAGHREDNIIKYLEVNIELEKALKALF